MFYYKKFIKKMSYKYKGIKIREKVFISYTLIMLIPVSIIGIISSIFSSRILKNETFQLTLNVVDQIKNNLEFNFKQMDSLTRSLYIYKDGNRPLISYMENSLPESQYENILVNKKFNDFFMGLSFLRDDISSIYICGNNGMENFYYRRKISGISYSPYGEWYEKSIKNRNKTTIINTHKQFYCEKGSPVFSLSRVILDTNLEKSIAVILVDYDIQSLRNICKNTNLKLNENIIICDNDGNTIYNTDEDKLYDKVDNHLMKTVKQHKGEFLDITYNNKKYYLVNSISDISGLNIVFLIPRDKLLYKTQKLILVIVAISIISMIFALVAANYFSKFITKPIKRLSNTIKVAEKGDLSVKVDVDSYDEIGELTESFNSMIYKIKILIDNEYKANLVKKEAQLKALLQQVNPHFIYNTLEIISGASIEFNVPMITQICKSLGQMLRYSIKTDDDVVTLEQELIHVNNYLKIHEYRFNDGLQVNYHIDEECKKVKVIKLMLQPLIENAINHGIQKTQRKGQIDIIGKKSNGILYIDIIDNGIGIKEEELTTLKEVLKTDSENYLWKLDKKKSIGLRNVNARLCLHFGNDYKLDMESTYDVGTVIHIKIPVIEEGDRVD